MSVESLRKQRELLQKQRDEDFDIFTERVREASQPRRMSISDAIGQAVTTITPALLGYAFAEEPGALAGLQGGSAGADRYLQAVRDRLAQEQSQELALAKLDRESIDQQDQQIRDLQAREGRLEDRKSLFGRGPMNAALSEALTNYEQTGDPIDAEILTQIKQDPAALSEYARLQRLKSYKDSSASKEERANAYLDFQKEGRQAKEEKYLKETTIRFAKDDGSGEFIEFGQAVNPKAAKEVSNYIKGYANRSRSLRKLYQLYKKNGNAFYGEDYNILKALISDLTLEIKGPEGYNLGAALTQPEINLLNGLLPRLQANPNATITESMMDSIFQRSFEKAIKEADANFSRRFSMSLSTNGIFLPDEFEEYLIANLDRAPSISALRGLDDETGSEALPLDMTQEEVMGYGDRLRTLSPEDFDKMPPEKRAEAFMILEEYDRITGGSGE